MSWTVRTKIKFLKEKSTINYNFRINFVWSGISGYLGIFFFKADYEGYEFIRNFTIVPISIGVFFIVNMVRWRITPIWFNVASIIFIILFIIDIKDSPQKYSFYPRDDNMMSIGPLALFISILTCLVINISTMWNKKKERSSHR